MEFAENTEDTEDAEKKSGSRAAALERTELRRHGCEEKSERNG
jgi:hypothetical protein